MRNVSDKSCRENQTTHFLLKKRFSKIVPVFEMWKNIVERGRPQVTIWRMRIACWIPKATNTHSQYVIFIAFLRQQWLRERTSVLSYMYIASLVTSA